MEIKTEYRRDLQHTWMILSEGNVREKDSYAVRMLTENRIPGLLPCRTACMDGKLHLYYDISSCHSFKTVTETETIGRQMLEMLLISLEEIMERLEEYLLDPDGLLLDPACLYCDPEQTAVRFCWYPGEDICFREQVKILGSALLPKLDQTDRAAVVLGYRFYQYCEAEELTADVLRALLRQRTPEPEPRPVTREELERKAILDAIYDDREEDENISSGSFGRKLKTLFKRKKEKKKQQEESPEADMEYSVEDDGFGNAETDSPDGLQPSEEMPALFGATGLLVKERGSYGEPERQGEAETMLLTPDMLLRGKEPVWSLQIREGTNGERSVSLTENLYFVGKKGSGATLQLSSPAVSRLHAKLQKRDGSWYLNDLNSRNGTGLLNPSDTENAEKLLQPEESVRLQDGDRIRFADVICTLTVQ